MPFARPVIVQGDDGQVWVPLVQETLYPVIGDPLSAGVAHVRFALWLVMVEVTLVGASGVVARVTLCDALECGDSPISFRARTWNE